MQPTPQDCSTVENQAALLGALGNGVKRVVTFNGLAAGSAGTKTLRIFVDMNCAIAEINEENNQRTKICTVE